MMSELKNICNWNFKSKDKLGVKVNVKEKGKFWGLRDNFFIIIKIKIFEY